MLTAAAAALLGLLATGWVVAERRSGKKESRRFMTAMRLSLMDAEVQRACLHIEKSFGDPLLMPATVCTAIVTGEAFMEALFLRELGMSIAAYVDQVRIHHAKRIAAQDPAIPSPSIAALVGCSDGAAFDALFEKVTGAAFEVYCKEKRMYS